MFGALRNLLRPTSATPPPAGATPALVHPVVKGPLHLGQPVPAYPPQQAGIPAVPIDALLETQAELIRDIRYPIDLSRDEYTRYALPVIRRYAAMVHLLPASEAMHHTGIGGLLRHGLEVAFYAARRSEGREFALQHELSRRHHLKPRWRLAIVLAALLHDLGKPLVDVGAVSADGQLIWNPHELSMTDWLERHQLPYYYIHWRLKGRSRRHELISMAGVGRVIGAEPMAYIGDNDPGHEITNALLDAIAGSDDPNNVIAQLVRAADGDSLGEDMSRIQLATVGSAGGSANSIAARVMLAMRELVRDGDWAINTGSQPLWTTTEGLHLIHPVGLRAVLDRLAAKGITGIPGEPMVLAGLLAQHRFIDECRMPDGSLRNTWNIRLTAGFGARSMSAVFKTLRIADPNYLFDGAPLPTPAEAVVLGDDDAPLNAPAADTATPAPASPPAPIATGVSATPAVGTTEALPLGPPPSSNPAPAESAPRPAPKATRRERSTAKAESTPSAVPDAVAAATSSLFPADPAAVRSEPDWFAERGHAGELLRAIAEDAAAGRKLWERDLILVDGRVGLVFPAALEGYGDAPVEIARCLAEQRWVRADPAMPDATARPIERAGKTLAVVVLQEEPSTRVLALAPYASRASSAPDGAPSATRPAPRGAFAFPAERPTTEPAIAAEFAVWLAHAINGAPIASLTVREVRDFVGKYCAARGSSRRVVGRAITGSGADAIIWIAHAPGNPSDDSIVNPTYAPRGAPETSAHE